MSLCANSISAELDKIIFNLNGVGAIIDVGLNNLTTDLDNIEVPVSSEIDAALLSLSNDILTDLTNCNGDIEAYDECSTIASNAALNLTKELYTGLFGSLGSYLSGLDNFLSLSEEVFDLNNSVNKLGISSEIDRVNELIGCLVTLGVESAIIGSYYDQLDVFQNTYFINNDGTFNIDNAMSTMFSQFSSFSNSDILEISTNINTITEEISTIATDLQEEVQSMREVIEVVPEELY